MADWDIPDEPTPPSSEDGPQYPIDRISELALEVPTHVSPPE